MMMMSLAGVELVIELELAVVLPEVEAGPAPEELVFKPELEVIPLEEVVEGTVEPVGVAVSLPVAGVFTDMETKTRGINDQEAEYTKVQKGGGPKGQCRGSQVQEVNVKFMQEQESP